MIKHKILHTLLYVPSDEIYVDTIFSEKLDPSLEHNFYIEKFVIPEKFIISFGKIKLFKQQEKSYFKLFFCKKFNHWNSSYIPLEGLEAYDSLAWVQVAQWPSNVNFLSHLELAIQLFSNDSQHSYKWISQLNSEFISSSF